ncbi:MAG: AEC family transporter [Clostridiales bacterium]|nr:AEC family transporter [Clostridiales bacterium]
MPNIFVTMVSSLISLFICMAAGYLCRKVNILNRGVTGSLSSFLILITQPCTIFMSLQRPFSIELLFECFIVFCIAVAAHFIGWLIGFALAKALKLEKDVAVIWQFVLIFSNIAYMGIPIINAIYGSDGLIFNAMFITAFNLFAFTIGIKLFESNKNPDTNVFNWRTFVKNPPLIAIFLGLIFFITSLSFPAPIQNGFKLLSDMTTPLSLVIVGSTLAMNDITKIFNDKKLYILMFFRLIFLPMIVLICAKPFIHNPVMLGTSVITVGMPSAALVAIFAERYEGNSDYASKAVFVSTVLCLVTTPILTLFL